jgi:hypothetical protein
MLGWSGSSRDCQGLNDRLVSVLLPSPRHSLLPICRNLSTDLLKIIQPVRNVGDGPEPDLHKRHPARGVLEHVRGIGRDRET